MIRGFFLKSTPKIDGSTWVVAPNLRRPVEFILDTSVDRTRISVPDLQPRETVQFPPDDAVAIAIEGGRALALERKAFITFRTEAGEAVMLPVTVLLVDDAPGQSRLGRDVLNQWLMVYDEPGDSLLFEPLR